MTENKAVSAITSDTDTNSVPGYRRAVAGAAIGHVVEWYDVLLYGSLAIPISNAFFGDDSQSVRLIETFAVFALAYLVRPIGGIVLGHLSDRIGRVRTLVVTLTLMASATCLIGLIPGSSSIGSWAPLLLLLARLAQGFSAGGEFSSASALVNEYTQVDRRGRMMGFIQIGFALSAILASGITAAIAALVSDDALQQWAWRIPFLLAAPLGVVGFIIRMKVAETPVSQQLREGRSRQRMPLVTAIKTSGLTMLLLFGFCSGGAVANNYMTSFYPAFLVQHGSLKVAQSSLVSLSVYTGVALLVMLMGWIADVRGRRMVRIGGFVFLAIVAIPSLTLATKGSPTLAILGMLLIAVPLAASNVSNIIAVSELFRPEFRASAGGLPYNIAFSVVGGTAPLIGALLSRGADGGEYWVAGYLAAVAVVSLVCGALLPETRWPRSNHDRGSTE